MTISMSTLSHIDNLADCVAVRHEVFVVGQNIPHNLEQDGKDTQAPTFHVVAKDGTTPVGTARVVFPKPNQAKIGRMAVLESQRGKGIAKLLMAEVLKELERRNIPFAALSAQKYVANLYEHFGFEVVGDEYIEAGIPHVYMTKSLTKEVSR
ncbi:MAG: GNAT family N-acetyltransferase [Alphaproteobacteria bacterium]